MKNQYIARLAYADVAFRDALALCDAACLPDVDETSHLYFGMISGLAVSYFRPFTTSNCLGSLGGEYTKFPNESLQTMHSYLQDARNALTAHSDFSFQRRIANEFGLKDPTTVKLILASEVFANTNPITIPRKLLGHVRNLLDFQIERVQTAISRFGAAILKDTETLGEYDFPVFPDTEPSEGENSERPGADERPDQV